MPKEMGDNHLSLAYEEAKNLIRVRGTGVWSLALMDRHISELEDAVRRSRRSHLGLRILADISEANVQSKEVTAKISACSASLYGPHDRVAIIVASSLVKMQMSKIERQAKTQMFLSPNSAETWLLAYDNVRSCAS